MAEFFAELKRRQMFRVAAAYAVVAWVLLQLINNLAQALRLPDWVPATVVVLLALGFPVALLFAWIQQMAPADATAPRAKANRLDWILVGGGGITAVIAIFLFQQFASGPTAVTQPKGVDAAKSAANSPASAISLAVLPFSNLSSDPEQEFFSDGITEEITTALAKVPDLRVVGRTSAFQFKGKSEDLRVIGQALSATHLIEGSVRKAGDRVRITAQLIKADDGTHLWAEDYDRQLTDIFQIQEDIARAIATSLRMPLGLKPGRNLVSTRNVDPEIYQEFLRILAKQANNDETVDALEKLLDRAPNFAKAWAELSITYFRAKTARLYEAAVEPAKDLRQQLTPILDKAEKAAREAIRLDETEVLAYGTLVEIEFHRNNWVAAEDLLRKALELDPYGSDLLGARAFFLSKTGRLKQVLPVVQQMVALEPLESGGNYGLGWSYLANNRPDEAINLLAGTFTNPGTLSVLASAYAWTGQYDKAANAILQMGQGRLGRQWGQATFEEAARLMREAPRKGADSKALLPLHEQLNFVYAYVGAEDRLLDFAERSYEAGVFGEVRYLFNPVYSPARKTERFKTLVRNVGLVDYWKARGWPDMCHPTAGDDFECE
jgi:TolB-like protein